MTEKYVAMFFFLSFFEKKREKIWKIENVAVHL